MLVVSCVLLLTPLAYGMPPDPGWIAGLWDDGDYDTVVAFVSGTAATTTDPSEATPPLLTIGRLSARNAAMRRAALPSDCPTRAPPLV